MIGSFGVTGTHNKARAHGPGVTIGRSGASFGTASFVDEDYWPLNTCLYVTDFKGNDFPDRYDQHISSAEWKSLKHKIIEQRGNRCECCGQEGASLDLHHVHYRSLGNEQPEDVELLCSECHSKADEARRPKRDYPQEGLIVGVDGDYWGKFDPDTIYIPLPDGRNVPVKVEAKVVTPRRPRRPG